MSHNGTEHNGLAQFMQGTYLPAGNFVTNGDAAFSYSTQTGTWVRNGNLVWVDVSLAFTVTYTTASGSFRVSLPFVVSAPTTFTAGNMNNVAISSGLVLHSAGAAATATNATFVARTLASEAAVVLSTTHLPSGATAYTVNFSGSYLTG